MAKLELVSVETDTKKTYKASDKFVFSITVNALEDIPEDVEFEAHYFGDAYSEHHDQRIGHALIGPFEKGKQRFDLEANAVDLTKIPIKTLFGLTTILIVAKFKNQQFLRIGYVVNVSYPGIDASALQDSDDEPRRGQDSSEGSAEEEEIEVMDDAELDEEDGEGEKDDEGYDSDEDDEGDDDEGDASGADDEDLDIVEDEEDAGAEAPTHGNLEEMLSAAFRPKHDREPIPLETPITNGKDEFEYRGMAMKKSRIEMALMESPIIHVFDISWDSVSKKRELDESSGENDKNKEPAQSDADAASKKQKIDN